MNVRYIIQARLSSTRLPGKILMPIGQKPLIGHIIDRLLSSGAGADEVCFALADETSDDSYDQLNRFIDRHKIRRMTGDTHNVLARYIQASDDMSPTDIIVRLTGDNPFIDYKILNDTLRVFRGTSGADLAYPYKLPLGMGFEMFTREALVRQLNYPLQPHHCEHVTTFIKEHRELFCVRQVDYYENSPDIRLTIDYEEDLRQARQTFDYFHERGKDNFCSDEILELYKTNADFFGVNRDIRQRESTHSAQPAKDEPSGYDK